MKKSRETESQKSAKPEQKAETKGQGSSAAETPDGPPPRDLFFNYRWFLSSAVRHGSAMRKHVRRLINAQRDILSTEAIRNIEKSVNDLTRSLNAGADKKELETRMTELEAAANKWLRQYPNAGMRENVEVFLVAIAVAMGIRTFFIQPFKIPTGSMQPTLFGVTSTNLIDVADFKIPQGFERFKQWLHGVSYVHVIAKNGGMLEDIKPPLRLLIFNIRQEIKIGGVWQTIWFPPDYGSDTLQGRADLSRFAGRTFSPGEEVVKLQVRSGDYLFVNRLTFNFRKPRRGEIIVFETRGIDADARDRWHVPGDQFYIKRLVGLGNEKLAIGPDSHLIINGVRLDASAPGFENVYGNSADYKGHKQNQNFANGEENGIRPNHLMVMGDNTESSLDSRYFGDVDENAVIGKAWFVYWPLSSRFGLGYK